jgi:hypothetical protein
MVRHRGELIDERVAFEARLSDLHQGESALGVVQTMMMERVEW